MKKQTVVGGALVIAAAASLWQTSATADTLWAEKSGWIKLVGYGHLQHTYACYSKPGVTRACYANPGSSSGGSYLSRTIGSGTGSKLTCAKGGSCAISWGLTGYLPSGREPDAQDCGKTVSAASGYSISVRLFGTYGTATSWKKCRGSCGI